MYEWTCVVWLILPEKIDDPVWMCSFNIPIYLLLALLRTLCLWTNNMMLLKYSNVSHFVVQQVRKCLISYKSLQEKYDCAHEEQHKTLWDECNAVKILFSSLISFISTATEGFFGLLSNRIIQKRGDFNVWIGNIPKKHFQSKKCIQISNHLRIKINIRFIFLSVVVYFFLKNYTVFNPQCLPEIIVLLQPLFWLFTLLWPDVTLWLLLP